jgi:hypothetical protein
LEIIGWLDQCLGKIGEMVVEVSIL